MCVFCGRLFLIILIPVRTNGFFFFLFRSIKMSNVWRPEDDIHVIVRLLSRRRPIFTRVRREQFYGLGSITRRSKNDSSKVRVFSSDVLRKYFKERIRSLLSTKQRRVKSKDCLSNCVLKKRKKQ